MFDQEEKDRLVNTTRGDEMSERIKIFTESKEEALRRQAKAIFEDLEKELKYGERSFGTLFIIEKLKKKWCD